MNDLISGNTKALTMSSTQLSELLGYSKKEVNRKIKDMFQAEIDGGIITPSLDARGYVDEYDLEEVESNMFVAKWDITHLRKVSEYFVVGKRKPIELSKTELCLMVIESEKEKEILALKLDNAVVEVDRLQGVVQTTIAQFTVGMTAPKFCHQMNGVNTQEVNNYLVSIGILRRTKDGVVPSSYARDRYFKESSEMHNGKPRYKSEILLTGAKWIYRAYLSKKLPMKKGWNGEFVHMIFKEK